MTATILWITIPLVALAFALWSGIPLWMTFRHPDRDPSEIRTVPAYLAHRYQAAPSAPPAQPAEPVRERERELVGAGSR